QLYLPDTAILITRFMTETGTAEVVDFMPPITGSYSTKTHRLVRMVRCVRGRVGFEFEVAPRFDYGRATHTTQLTDDGAVFDGGDVTLTVHSARASTDARLARVRVTEDADIAGSLTLDAGQTRGFVVEVGADGPPRGIPPAEFERMFAETVAFWRSWLAQST